MVPLIAVIAALLMFFSLYMHDDEKSYAYLYVYLVGLCLYAVILVKILHEGDILPMLVSTGVFILFLISPIRYFLFPFKKPISKELQLLSYVLVLLIFTVFLYLPLENHMLVRICIGVSFFNVVITTIMMIVKNMRI